MTRWRWGASSAIRASSFEFTHNIVLLRKPQVEMVGKLVSSLRDGRRSSSKC